MGEGMILGTGTPGGETFSSRLVTGCIYMSGWRVLDMSFPDLAVNLEKYTKLFIEIESYK